VDVSEAMHVVHSQVLLRGRSDEALIGRIMQMTNPIDEEFGVSAKKLLPAAGLGAGVYLRPVEALHLLSLATSPRYQDDLFDNYVQWGLLRYLGFFELSSDGYSMPGLAVSDAGKRIVGNQRRITSEEMGIGFGALLAIRWFQATGATPNVPISVVDIDVALDDRYIYAAGSRQTVSAGGARRPDYLIICNDPALRGRYRVRALECKGTRKPDYAVRQLASAVEQLSGIRVSGRIPAGLAVSTITANSGVSYLALDPEGDDETYEVNSNTIDRTTNFRLSDADFADISPVDLTSAAVRASWATLADFGGNLSALERWSPAVMLRRLSRLPRERTTFDTPFGVARGTSITFIFQGRQLNVRYGIDEIVDQRMTQGVAESIIEAQAEFAQRVAAPRATLDEPTGNDLYSATSDGSIFSLRLS
jgi:hypothetical protein